MSGDDPKPFRWKFIVEDELYGKLTCSFDLEKDCVDGLDVFFADVLAEPKGRTGVVNLNHVCMCREEALRLVREKIERNIQDAMEGLIYEVRLQVLRSFNGWHFFINDNPTQNLREIRKFYVDCANDRMEAHQGRRPGREAFLRKMIDAYTRAAEKANKKATATAKGRKNARPGRYGVRRVDWRVIDGKLQFFGVVTKAALAREMQLAGHGISESVLSRQMKRYKIQLTDLERVYDDERIKRERA